MKRSTAKNPRTVAPAKRTGKLARLKKRKGIIGDPDSIIHMHWSKEWSELRNVPGRTR